MATHQAVVLESHTAPLQLTTVPTPLPTAGTIVVSVLSTTVGKGSKAVMTGAAGYPISFPLVPGNSCIGRVHTIAPDTTSLEPGQLVFCSGTIVSRDDPDVATLLGAFYTSLESKKLADGEWKNGCWAEIATFPAENVVSLDEDVLCNKLGYSFAQLSAISGYMISFGGLDDIGLKSGDTIIIAPGTGALSGMAVTLSLAMGAKVVAAGRNNNSLEALESMHGATGRLITVALTGDEAVDGKALRKAAGGKGADKYMDLSPPSAEGTTHIAAAISALKTRGSVSLMGGINGNIEIPYPVLTELSFRGKFMYDRKQIIQLVKMIEIGVLRLNSKETIESLGKFGLKDIQAAVDIAAANEQFGKSVVLEPYL